MDDIHNIGKPGGILFRIIRKLISKKELYPRFDYQTQLLEDRFIARKVIIKKQGNRNFEKLFKPLLGFDFLWIYLHGSQADHTANSFSDIDDLIVVDLDKMDRKVLIKFIQALNKVDLKFCRSDPLQHHSHFIISQQALKNYDASYLPLETLENSYRIKGPKIISYNMNPERTRKGLLQNIIATSKEILSLFHGFRNHQINLYNLKKLVGSFVLMPAFLFQYSGEFLNKPMAILRANEIFSDSAYKCIEWSTNCRRNWHKVTNCKKFLRYSKLPYFFLNPHLYRIVAKKTSPELNLAEMDMQSLNAREVNDFLQNTLTWLEKN